ncbi:transcriptional regulator [Salmonella enterica subsp. diarizonae]|nr:transcriptional regulator [Salmonella enterica subsp. diarizonae]
MKQDLFGGYQDDTILAHVDNESGDTSRYPALLAELNDLLRKELARLGVEPVHSLEIVVAICKHLGGGQVYIPRGQVLDSLIRDLRIWNDFNGRNINELAAHYGVSYKTVYKAIRRMRQLKYRQYQPTLF